MSEGSLVCPHVIKMIGYIQRLEILGFVMDVELSMDIVMQSLLDSFSQFILNFNMNAMEKTLSELLRLLKTMEKDMTKFKLVLLVAAAHGKGKGKQGRGKAKANPKFKRKTQDVIKPT
ncbi:uncharacterized protein LOC116139187 [Pistacia vera]|uniref:uncharacterized protein LOC116139187 n=1 Tax=Pistacia vera TaxID=55513 RepID=UPI0012639C21|nr:uncharacterized protein LOC116139187 [Pistacia vera]